MTILALLCAVLIFCVACWIVSVCPVPAKAPYIRNVLYVTLGVIAIVYLSHGAGCSPTGILNSHI